MGATDQDLTEEAQCCDVKITSEGDAIVQQCAVSSSLSRVFGWCARSDALDDFAA